MDFKKKYCTAAEMSLHTKYRPMDKTDVVNLFHLERKTSPLNQ